MIRGLYTAASALSTGERLQDILANNLANAGTNGFKEQDGVVRSFPDALLYSMNDHTGSGPSGIDPASYVGKISQGVFLQESLSRFTQGKLQSSQNPYAFAIEDTAPAELMGANGQVTNPESLERSFFAIDDGSGNIRYTRDGDFALGQDGFLHTQTGDYVLAVDAKGQAIPGSRVGTATDGNGLVAYAPDATGALAPTTTTPQPGVVTVDNAAQLIDEGNGEYTLGKANIVVIGQPQTGGTGVTTPAGIIKAHFVEGSNVDPAKTMVNMMNVMRTYEANTKVVKTMDQTLEKACDEVGKV